MLGQQTRSSKKMPNIKTTRGKIPESFDGTRQYSAKEVAEIGAMFMDEYFKHSASGTTPTNQPPYGPYADQSAYGAFSIPGYRPGMYSNFIRPRTLTSVMGVQPSLNTNEKIGIMTGVTGGSGSNATDFCGTAPTAGQLKRCIQNYPWGWFYLKSQLLNIMHVGERNDYSDYVDHELLNQEMAHNPFIPDMMGSIDLSNRAGITLNNELFTMGVEMERSFERVLIAGNLATAPANTQRGFIKEYRGLEGQITTGKADLDTGVACPGADSTVVTWGSGIDQTVGGRNFVQAVRDTFFGLQEIGRQVGMEGVQYVISMPFKMFQALTYVWSCQYWTYACSNASASNPNFTYGQDVRGLQLDMQNNYYLLIDGNRIPVVISDGIRETNASSTVITADEMFIIPVGWAGKRLLNCQYKNYGASDITEFANFGPAPEYQPMQNGMYMMTTAKTNFCKELLLGAKFRVILDAPFLAGVINTIQYSFNAPSRSYDPANTRFYADGGATRWDGNFSVLGG